MERKRTKKLEQLVSTELLQHGFSVGKLFDLCGIELLQNNIYLDSQISILSTLHGNIVISRTPTTKLPGMQEIVLYYSKDHYDLITNIDGYIMKGKNCHVWKPTRTKIIIVAQVLF